MIQCKFRDNQIIIGPFELSAANRIAVSVPDFTLAWDVPSTHHQITSLPTGGEFKSPAVASLKARTSVSSMLCNSSESDFLPLAILSTGLMLIVSPDDFISNCIPTDHPITVATSLGIVTTTAPPC
ncbi:hypothetical protein XNC1_0531 [Xenorhabdus nematophila ATCC 19061]|uniref:Uncharacterized protein n=1 Tax=Xenorhabdus nematophila (strain ATCC 19061 / DSM 3370 / CCUG 14189 / LMG 1036 / NCIMB 9965 / AN6) TaxID=406817 RepID=D3VIQ5_XENNA|nr:hypothetical protein XNC1_0531 [Xenorhabdus nematophila ATCC 19061]